MAEAFIEQSVTTTTSDTLQRLLQIFNDVLNGFGADGEADEIGGDAGGGLFFGGELLVSGAVGVNDQRFAVAHVGEVAEEFHAVDQLDAVFFLLSRRRPFDSEAEDCAAAFGEIFLAASKRRMRFEAGVVHPAHFGM